MAYYVFIKDEMGNTKSVTVDTETELVTSGTGAKKNLWSHEAILLLMETFKNKQHLFMNQTNKKQDIWRDVAETMTQEGFSFTRFTVEKKWHNMKLRYKSILSSKAVDENCRITWPYYKLMEELLHGDQSITFLSGPKTATSKHTQSATPLATRNMPASPASSDSSSCNENIPPQAAKKIKIDYSLPPAWFRDYAKQSLDLQSQMLQIITERNRHLQKFLEKL